VSRSAPRCFSRSRAGEPSRRSPSHFTGDSLDKILNNFEARAYRFISLDEAMADPAYQTPDTFVTKFGPTWLWRWTRSRGVKVSFNDDPEPPTWVTELYSKH
jgi:hypothetical protein